MAMILPKGIVVNSPDIEGQIERIDREPLKREEIARFWKVYTTTGRRLRDPTAERLENYWWRIWGSRKRELKGATVARLFAHISDGESFVPLRSPVNRDEGSPPSNRTRPGPVTSSSSTTALQYRPSTTSAASRAPPVMPPPILKKSRGPSTTGPRPTARFISPHDSEVEVDPMSPVSPNSHVVVQPPSQPPSPSRQQKIETQRLAPASAGKKKSAGFVASTAANKKRPVIVRRQSSQTSQTSQSSSNDSATKTGEAARLGAVNDAPPVTRANKETGQPTKFQEIFSPATTHSLSPRKQPSSTRPTTTRRTSPRKSSSSVKKKANGNSVDEEPLAIGEPGPSIVNSPLPVQNGKSPIQDVGEVEVQRFLLQEANTSMNKALEKTSLPSSKSEVQILHGSTRSRSDEEQPKQGTAALRLLPAEVKSTVGFDSTLASATAGITEALQSPVLESRTKDKGKGRDPEELKRAEMFTKRPVQPISSTPSTAPGGIGMLSKSKSQLTLLLEKDRARGEEHKKDEKRERSKDDKKRSRK